MAFRPAKMLQLLFMAMLLTLFFDVLFPIQTAGGRKTYFALVSFCIRPKTFPSVSSQYAK
jgi:hypothetical protein